MLARARRSVVVIDAGAPRNAPATAVHGLLARDGIPPAELLERGRAEVRGYGGQRGVGRGQRGGPRRRRVRRHAGRRPDGPRPPAAGRDRAGRRAAGRAGPARRWGRDVLHCPYCHGWEVRDQADRRAGQRSDCRCTRRCCSVSGATTSRSSPTSCRPRPASRRSSWLPAASASVDGEVTAVEIVDDRLVGVRLSDGTVVRPPGAGGRRRGWWRARTSSRRSDCGRSNTRSGIGEYVPADPTGRTDVPGVWVAGNVTDPVRAGR